MRNRVAKSVRDEAIEALLSCADDRIGSGRDYGVISCDLLGGDTDRLADAAYAAVAEAPWKSSPTMVTEYLEAAALLRDGWCPGDPVVLLRGAK